MLGKVFETTHGGFVRVVDYKNSKNITVEFVGDYKCVRVVNKQTLLRGTIRNTNKYFPSVFGVGFYGEGKFDRDSPSYSIWHGMLERCYSPLFKSKNKTYVNCVADESWHNLQNFSRWYEAQNKREGWHLDKDLLGGGSVYSAESCCLVPMTINNFLIRGSEKLDLPLGVRRAVTQGKFLSYISLDGRLTYLGTRDSVESAFSLYKNAKEKKAKELANEFKTDLDVRATEALMNWEITIED